MNTIFLKKKITVILTIVLLFSTTILSFPKNAEAIPVTDAGNIAQSTITAANTTAITFSEYSLVLKAYVLDTLATTLVKQLIRQITASVVNWINSGFEGSPSFITNPGGFFIDVADQITGDFIARNGGPLTELCSPFSIDIRLALAFKYHPNVPKKFSCTLGQALAYTTGKNVYGSSHEEYLRSTGAQPLGDGTSVLDRSSVNGASIGGFMAGDFNQGGWPAFTSLTMEPQNNIYGAYLTAESELSLQVANAQIRKQKEIDNGNGFLSWRNPSCKKEVKAHNTQVQARYAASSEEAYIESQERGIGGELNGGFYNGEVGEMKSVDSCPIETPGTLVASALGQSVNGPMQELGLVDSINEIVNALAAALVSTVLQKGLSAVSGSGPSDSTSYLNQIQAEAYGDVTGPKNEAANGIARYIPDARQYKANKNQSVNVVLEVKNEYESVKLCYEGKITGGQLTPAQRSYAESKINEVQSIISAQIDPILNRLVPGAGAADEKYNTLVGLQAKINNSATTEELNTLSTQFSNMVRSNSLITATDVLASQKELDDTKDLIEPIRTDARRRMHECQTFPSNFL